MARSTALLALVLAAACAAPERAARYRVEGTFGDGAPPLHVEPIAGGQAEYQLLSARLVDPEATLVRVVRSTGSAPVRVDLGRVRLRGELGEVPLVRVCLVEAPERCLDSAATRGRVHALEPGEAITIRASFAPLEPFQSDGDTPNPRVARLTLVEEGILVGGRPQPVEVPLERIEARRR